MIFVSNKTVSNLSDIDCYYLSYTCSAIWRVQTPLQETIMLYLLSNKDGFQLKLHWLHLLPYSVIIGVQTPL